MLSMLPFKLKYGKDGFQLIDFGAWPLGHTGFRSCGAQA